MNLEKLVADRELCERIPAGEFENTALVYIETEIPQQNKTEWRVTVANELIRRCHNRKLPAPTLQEILAVLPPYGKNEKILACCVPDWADFDARVFGEHWRVGYTGDCSINDKNPATAALKLWLELKGVENDKQ